MEFLTKSIPLAASLKDVDGKKGIITGYFAHFNSLDSDNDIIVPGAFEKTIKERGPSAPQLRIKHLRNHLPYEPIGVIQLLKEDSTGLYYESKAGSHFIGQDTIKMIESGVITEHSFGFEAKRKEEKAGVRYLKELLMWEGSSLTAWGANERTGAAMLKSMGKELYVKMITDRQKALEAFCRNSTATDETIELLLIEAKQLSQKIIDLSTQPTAPEEKATLPGDILDAVTNFRKTLNP